jgi:MinD-like ATPase involved in chromosome partitioning or flagellar assembly
VDLPTYTNIWRIEKRLYKLYDFRLPAPLPITWIGVFAGITVPYVFFLIAVGLPFNHNLVWLYVLPPGVLTWLTTRPVIESKRLPELVSSQLRYVSEPRSWCRMAPFAEKDEIMVSARVWHRHPPKGRPQKAKKSPARARPGAPARQAPTAAPARAGARTARAGVRVPRAPRTAAKPLATAQPLEVQPLETAQPFTVAQQLARPPLAGPSPERGPEMGAVPSPVQVPERTPARRSPKRPQNRPAVEPSPPSPPPSWPSWPLIPEPGTVTGPADRETGTARPSVWTSPPAAERPGTRPLEVAHDSDPVLGALNESSGPTAWPSAEASLLPLVRPLPDPAPFPEAGAFPEVNLDPEPDTGAAANGIPAVGWDPAADDEYNGGSGARSGSASGPARRHLAGFRHGLGRKADRPASPASPPAEDTGDAAPSAPAWPQPPAALAKARARWMLRAQPAPAPADDQPAPAQLAPAGLAPAASAPPAPEITALEITAPENTAPEPPVLESPTAAAPEAEAEPAEAELIQPEAPAAPEPEAAETAVPEIKAARPADEVTHEAEPPAPSHAERAPGHAERAPGHIEPAPSHVTPAPSHTEPASAAARFVAVERERPLPSIERALSGPGSRGDASSWRRQVKVVAGGQGPGKRDQETLDRDRARLPLAAPSRIAVLGCTRGAGQTVTALMAGHILAAVRGIPVAALDLNPGPTSLAARHAPATTPQALLAGREPEPADPPELLAGPGPGARLDVVAGLPGHGVLEGADFGRLADLLTERYSLTMIDPSPSGLTRVLAAADQLILVAPASPDAATSLANTQQWLGAHGYGELAARAVTVVNGVSKRTMNDVLRAESVARGRCRAIVRVPWDDCLAARSGSPAAEPSPSNQRPQSTQYPQVALQPQARLAYTALAGVLVSALSAASASAAPGRNPGEHSD